VAKTKRSLRKRSMRPVLHESTLRQAHPYLFDLKADRYFGEPHIGTRKKCGPCQQRSQCTTGPFWYLAIHMNEARQRARDPWTTPEFKYGQRQRKKVEALFAELKSHIGLRRLRLRRLKFVREQFFLAATAQNIKRLVRFLSGPTTPLVHATAKIPARAARYLTMPARDGAMP